MPPRGRVGATGGDRSVHGPTPSAPAHLVDVLARGGDAVLGAVSRVVWKEALRRRRPVPAALTPRLIRRRLLLGERQDGLLLRHHLPVREYRGRRRPVPVGKDGHTTGQWYLGSWSDSRSLGLLGSAVLGARSSWGSHAHPLVSCFSSLVLFVSLFVISLVVVFVSIIVIMSLRMVQRRWCMAGTACG